MLGIRVAFFTLSCWFDLVEAYDLSFLQGQKFNTIIISCSK